MDSSLIQTIAVYALPVIFAITLHEAAHGYVARMLGDNTAYVLGRVSFNPMRHIDPLGTIVIPLVLYFATSGAFMFGYAKPVPVAFGNLRNPRWGSLWVALAGPGCNFVQALVWGVVGVVLAVAGVDEPFFTRMAAAGVGVNLVLGVLNLFPLPPLDGGRVLVALLPTRAAIALSRIEPYGFFIVMALVMTGALTRYWLRPLVDLGYDAVTAILTPLVSLFS
ncbi:MULTISPECIES: site-2 protease family protein [Paraburkholderia]|uniref:Zn-dependent protease (Includes SpoIVFB) n=1 Tax=Paraburkholderia megapolitana TaxID=420953 RepID=A0A1I3NJE2_9BURK|nr:MULTISPECIES: site-2 protease family protein [Paraburkholderia]MCX4162178.1 site-2 protease family protein [Paraburkholderia megapolitana]MDN7157673.1 site-2 protease family protein [Paraburkholderia sp. CHISQ3]MDQ6494720.1 site-2 protease family protein [Paraburkholderia megapolitana]QDQ84397.1 site-2 protease family protein [Paraburkholderia megapolitana]SFJ09287.1 Zn-dependent protease (includes SpoIVFB) [Paraburkholderia megapolitana]